MRVEVPVAACVEASRVTCAGPCPSAGLFNTYRTETHSASRDGRKVLLTATNNELPRRSRNKCGGSTLKFF